MYWIRIKNKSTNVFLLAMLLIICSLAQAAIEPHPLFCEGMVLQRNKSVPVWGWADPGEKVTVRFGDATTTVTANAKGKWGLRLPAMPASSQPRTMVVSGAGGSRVEIADVLVGEVWTAQNLPMRTAKGPAWPTLRCPTPYFPMPP